MAKFLERNWSTILLLLGGYYAYSQIVIRGREAIAPMTKPVSKALAEIQFMINDSNYIKYPKAGFYLNPEKLDFSNKVNDLRWLQAITLLHDKHEDLLNHIFDNDLRLKPQYEVLIGLEVSPESVATVDKV